MCNTRFNDSHMHEQDNWGPLPGPPSMKDAVYRATSCSRSPVRHTFPDETHSPLCGLFPTPSCEGAFLWSTGTGSKNIIIVTECC